MTRDADHHALNGWQDCPQGEVGRLVARMQRQRRRETLKQAAVVGTALSLLVMVGAFAVPRLFVPAERTYGGLSCIEVRAHAEAFLAGTLDKETMHKIEAHLSQCTFCRHDMDELRGGTESARIGREADHVVAKAVNKSAEPPPAKASEKYERCDD